jgi:hypothetical protein
MTTDDFYLLFVAFGGFLIAALVLWTVASIADRKRDAKSDPDVHSDLDTPSAPRTPGRKAASRLGRASEFRAGANHCRWRTEELESAVGAPT